MLADRSVPSQLHMGNGNGSAAWLFTRQSAGELRPYRFEPIITKEPGAQAAGRGGDSGPFSDVPVDLHGVKAPGETTPQ